MARPDPREDLTFLADAIRAVGNLATAAAAPQQIELPYDPRRMILAVDGKLQTIELPPPPRNHTVYTLAEIIAAAQRHADIDGDAPTVYHSPDCVVLVTNHRERYDRYTLHLHESAHIKTLRTLEDPNRSFTQQALVALLRHDLAGTVPETVLATVRRVTFARQANSRGEYEHGRDSLGKSVEAAVANAADIPEALTATVRVYRNPGIAIRHPIALTLTIDTQNELFKLRPLPDAIQNAVDAANAGYIAEFLAEGLDGLCPIVFGTP